MSNETFLTVRGYAGADPVVFSNSGGGKTTVLRIGVTARTRSRRTGKYEDLTTWYSVRCFGNLAENVALTIRKGAPILVRGRFVQRAWTGDDGVERTELVILADSLGLELATVTASYAKALGSQPAGGGPSGEGEAGLDAENASRKEESRLEWGFRGSGSLMGSGAWSGVPLSAGKDRMGKGVRGRVDLPSSNTESGRNEALARAS